MSGGSVCKCKTPIYGRAFVLQRKCNHSAFNGYRETPSRYSSVACKCGKLWRTKAAYVDRLPDADHEEWVRIGCLRPARSKR